MKNNQIAGYEAYDRPIERFVDTISITKTGRIGFNKSIEAKHNLSQFSHAVLYWNQTEQSLAIEFTNEQTNHAQLKLLVDKRGFGLHLNTLNFFQTYDINLDTHEGKYQYRKMSTKQFGLDRAGFVFIIKLAE